MQACFWKICHLLFHEGGSKDAALDAGRDEAAYSFPASYRLKSLIANVLGSDLPALMMNLVMEVTDKSIPQLSIGDEGWMLPSKRKVGELEASSNLDEIVLFVEEWRFGQNLAF